MKAYTRYYLMHKDVEVARVNNDGYRMNLVELNNNVVEHFPLGFSRDTDGIRLWLKGRMLSDRRAGYGHYLRPYKVILIC